MKLILIFATPKNKRFSVRLFKGGIKGRSYILKAEIYLKDQIF